MARMTSSVTTEQLAPLEVRRDEEIFATDGGWFRARWHFSFDEYNDPANMGIGTLRVFNHQYNSRAGRQKDLALSAGTNVPAPEQALTTGAGAHRAYDHVAD